MYDKSYDDSLDDLKNVLTRVNNNQTTQNQYQNITKYNIVSRLLRKYHQGWSWFFDEQEYRENWYENDDEDDAVILTQLDKLNNDLALESHLNMDNPKTLTERFLEKGRIQNPKSKNYRKADESLIKDVRNLTESVLPHAPQRTTCYDLVKYDIRLDKKDFVLATDSYVIYPRHKCLYHWFQSTCLIACAVLPALENPLLIPFKEKEGRWSHALHIMPEVKAWDGVSTYEDYLSNNVGENAYANDVLVKILVKGKPMEHYGVYEVHIYNGLLQAYYETKERSVNIDYDNGNDAEKKMKEKQVVFEFLYSYTQTVVDPCCVASFQYDLKLGVAMTIIIY
jgi:hypothetical protein